MAGWTTPKTWAPGNIFTPANANAYLSQNILALLRATSMETSPGGSLITAPILLQCGFYPIVTDASSVGTLNFPVSFPTDAITVIGHMSGGAGASFYGNLSVVDRSPSYVKFLVANPHTGALWGSGYTINVDWIAVGY